MAFLAEPNLTVSSIGDFEIKFFVPKVGSGEPQTGELSVQVVMSDGSLRHRKYNLLDRLGDDAPGATHLDNLILLRNYIRTRLENEVLP